MRPSVTMPGYHRGREPANKGKKRHLRCLPPPGLRPDSPRKRWERRRSSPLEKFAVLFSQISTTTSIGIRNRALITVLYRAGPWHSEALGLFTKDVDLAAGTIAILHGKGRPQPDRRSRSRG
ncbi:MAG: hypothetical protein WD313_04410, partial [Acidimicrobiia bacterium]